MLKTPPSVIYAQLKYMWAKSGIPEEKGEVLTHLRSLTSALEKYFRVDSNATEVNKRDETRKLLARCHFKQGEWQKALHGDWSMVWVFSENN